MCATIGFAYREGMVFGRTLELGVSLDNKILMVLRFLLINLIGGIKLKRIPGFTSAAYQLMDYRQFL